jgi:hypothetical protein
MFARVMKTLFFNLQSLVCFAGVGQIILAIVSLAIPRILNWKPELAKVHILIRQMFWTYAAYILVINMAFGLLSVFAVQELTNGSLLASALSGFIAFTGFPEY